MSAGTWNAPSAKEEKTLALQTQIQKLHKEKKKPKQQEGEKKGEGKEGSKKKKKKKKDLAKWMKVPSTNANKDKPKTIKGKEYFWCVKHARWAGHITSACQGKRLNKVPNVTQDPLPSPQTTTHLGLSWALSAIGLSDSK